MISVRNAWSARQVDRTPDTDGLDLSMNPFRQLGEFAVSAEIAQCAMKLDIKPVKLQLVRVVHYGLSRVEKRLNTRKIGPEFCSSKDCTTLKNFSDFVEADDLRLRQSGDNRSTTRRGDDQTFLARADEWLPELGLSKR